MFGFRLLPVFFVASVALGGDIQVLDQIVAKVNGDIVTTTDLTRSRAELEADLQHQGLSGDVLKKELAARSNDLLRDRVDMLLLVQKAKDLDINVDSEVTKQLANLQRQFKIADQEKFHDMVRQQSGMSFEDYRQQVRDGLMRQRLLAQEVYSKLVATRAEIQNYYDEHKNDFIRENRVSLSEILISTDGKNEKDLPALEKKAKDLVERARGTERFSDLARDFSDDQYAESGGQIGMQEVSKLDAKIASVLADHEKGYVTDPIRIPSGWLILRIDDRQKAGLASLEEVQNEITEKLLNPKADAAVRTYLTDLRRNAFLEIREGYVDSGAAPGQDTKWMELAQLKPETITKEEVAERVRRKRLLWLVPVPGTQTSPVSTSVTY